MSQPSNIVALKLLFKHLAIVVLWFMASGVALAEKQDELSLVDGKRVVMTYNARRVPSPDSTAPWYGRSGFIHPVYTPSGRIVTAAFPKDHMHQHGLMFAWTSSEFEGRPVDFWNSAARQGRVRHVETVRAGNDAFQVRLEHIDDTTPEPTAVLNETWEVKRVPHPSMHVFELVSTQTCASDSPLVIRQYHYGAMCVRGPEAWLNKRATMVTSEGQDREDGNHSRPNWVAMYSEIDGQQCGISTMSHPSNFRAPQPVRLHPSKPYFCFAPMVLGDFSIEPGKPYVSRFLFVAFDGAPDMKQLNALWGSFSKDR